jgi:hypothetical protein
VNFLWKSTIIVFAAILVGCGKEHSKQSEYLAYLCKTKTNECYEPDIYKFKVRKFENTVLLNTFDKDGIAQENHFFDNCQIMDRNNWKCGGLSMIEGQLVNNDQRSSELYYRYEKRR